MTYAPHELRVFDERDQLDRRLTDLRAFLASDILPQIPQAEQSRLRRQEQAMAIYSGILAERIATFTPLAGSPPEPAADAH